MPLGLTALGAAILFVVFGVVNPPPGSPLASVDVRPDEPFAAEWIADGQPARAWLDFDCTGCAFPFRGGARIEANGALVAEAPIEVWTGQGYAVSSYEGGGEDRVHGKLLFEIPAMPSGARARVTGSFTVPSPTVVWSSDGNRAPTPPQLRQLRLWVAR